jgi:hypothetical protein
MPIDTLSTVRLHLSHLPTPLEGGGNPGKPAKNRFTAAFYATDSKRHKTMIGLATETPAPGPGEQGPAKPGALSGLNPDMLSKNTAGFFKTAVSRKTSISAFSGYVKPFRDFFSFF